MLKPIKTEEQYDVALARIYDLMQTDVPEGSPEYNELEILVTPRKSISIRTLSDDQKVGSTFFKFPKP